MDLAAVKDAAPLVLARGSVAAARNARGLVADAEMLSGAGRLARAYSLAGLAVEEVGKAGSLAALAAMPENLRARAPDASLAARALACLWADLAAAGLDVGAHDRLMAATAISTGGAREQRTSAISSGSPAFTSSP